MNKINNKNKNNSIVKTNHKNNSHFNWSSTSCDKAEYSQEKLYKTSICVDALGCLF